MNAANTIANKPSVAEFQAMQARLKTGGHLLQHGLRGGYLTHLQGYERHFATWADVQAFAERVGGRA